jgi:tRNA (Thr-GGU) A37 N-methylase
MEISPVAFFRSPLTSKFGIPRQSGLAPSLAGTIVFTPEYRQPEAVRGLEDFDYLWLIWEFSANNEQSTVNSQLSARPEGTLSSERTVRSAMPLCSAKNCQLKNRLTVRPPRLGGNERVGVFASRSPFRPNHLGLSCVRIERIEMTAEEGPVVHVLGADLMDGTPIYDVKPYVAYADAHPEARSGFVDSRQWHPLGVDIPHDLEGLFSADRLAALREVLAQDPRPPFHHDPERVYGMPFCGYDVRFRVCDGVLHVVEVKKLRS